MNTHAILYIEDNLDNQRLVQRVLGSLGYTVTVADDGPSGLTLARETMPVLILVDLGIPGLDGYETTTRLRSLVHLDHVPIIALTAGGTPGSRERALVAGCDGYISKPVDIRLLPKQIEEFIAGKREVIPSPSPMETELLRDYNKKTTERLEQQVRELTKANAELQELDRLKNQFLSTLSHELRTPLTSLSGYLELYDRGVLGELTSPQREAIGVMRRSTDTLTQQLNNLLYFQELRTRTFTFRTVHLVGVVKPLLHQMQDQAAHKNIVLRVAMGAISPLQADPAALEILLRCLLENAIKFTDAGGKINVMLHDEHSRVLVRVEDTGCGIPEQAYEKIFLPFYQVDSSLARSYAGSGLGLAIARHVAEAHGGQISVQSKPGQGTTFGVVLPRNLH